MCKMQAIRDKMHRLAELMPEDSMPGWSIGRFPIEILSGLGFSLVQFWTGQGVDGPWSMFWNDGHGNEIEILPWTTEEGKEVVHIIGTAEGESGWVVDFTRPLAPRGGPCSCPRMVRADSIV